MHTQTNKDYNTFFTPISSENNNKNYLLEKKYKETKIIKIMRKRLKMNHFVFQPITFLKKYICVKLYRFTKIHNAE